jgi:hypothetical protein
MDYDNDSQPHAKIVSREEWLRARQDLLVRGTYTTFTMQLLAVRTNLLETTIDREVDWRG